jgi:hypothetical protein
MVPPIVTDHFKKKIVWLAEKNVPLNRLSRSQTMNILTQMTCMSSVLESAARGRGRHSSSSSSSSLSLRRTTMWCACVRDRSVHCGC